MTLRQAFYECRSGQALLAAAPRVLTSDRHPRLTRCHRPKRSASRRRLYELFEQHPDHTLFASLPGAGDFLAPALLAKFGDDRERFPAPASLQCLAGTCPV
ncbi:MAG: transposase, partial [Anaerolineales bacterium]